MCDPVSETQSGPVCEETRSCSEARAAPTGKMEEIKPPWLTLQPSDGLSNLPKRDRKRHSCDSASVFPTGKRTTERRQIAAQKWACQGAARLGTSEMLCWRQVDTRTAANVTSSLRCYFSLIWRSLPFETDVQPLSLSLMMRVCFFIFHMCSTGSLER